MFTTKEIFLFCSTNKDGEWNARAWYSTDGSADLPPRPSTPVRVYDTESGETVYQGQFGLAPDQL